MSEPITTVRLRQRHDYQFQNQFGAAVPELLTDEPAPLGQAAGPSPVQLLAAAVGNCLASSLLFALRKYKQPGEPIACDVQAEVARNAEKRLRVSAMTVRLTLGTNAEQIDHLERILGSFEDFCTVTGSIRQCIAVQVQVFDAQGSQLK
jgi:uncharacterized OsmC-like protein